MSVPETRIDPADLPPVTVVPVNPNALPPIPTQEDNIGHYQQVLLDLSTGELSFHCPDWRQDRLNDPEQQKRYRPGALTPPIQLQLVEPVEPLRAWIIDSWAVEPDDPHVVSPRPFLTADVGQDFIEGLAPLAQRLIDGLVHVSGTDDLDWTAQAVAAARNIHRACSRYQEPPTEHHDLVDFADVVAAVPDLVDPAWVSATNADLDRAADYLQRWTLVYRDNEGRIVRGERTSNQHSKARLTLCGIRAWLYAYRATAAANLTVVDAAHWYTTRPAPVPASATDERLAAIAETEAAAAAAQGVKLVGLTPALTQARDIARGHVWDELGELGRATAEAEARTKQLRSARAGLIAQVIGWGEPRSDNNAEIGRQARMSREAVANLRERLEADISDAARSSRP